MSNYQIRRGDIFYIVWYGEPVGSEQGSGRPAIIVSNDMNNEFSGTVEIVYLTTRPKKYIPTHATINSTGQTSTVLCEQVTTISKDRLGNYIGHCTDEEMQDIGNAIRISLGLDEPDESVDQEEEAQEEEDVSEPEDETSEEIRIERNMYKMLYEQLLNRIVPQI